MESLHQGTADRFCVVRSQGVGASVEARAFSAPDALLARIEVGRDIRQEGAHQAWDFLPPLVSLAGARGMGLTLVHTQGHSGPQLVRLPAGPFARYSIGVEEYGLSVTVLPDGHRVVVQSRKLGGSFAVWDVFAEQLAATPQIHAMYPLAFASNLSPAGTLWAASGDTLFEFDTASWELEFSARLRERRSGGIVGWVRSIEEGRTLLCGWNLHQPATEGWTAPGHGEVLAVDTESRVVERLGQFPRWTESAVLRRPQGDVIAEAWGNDEAYSQQPARSEPHPLFAPRSPDDHDWR